VLGNRIALIRAEGSHQPTLPIPATVVQPETFAWSEDGRRVLWAVSRGLTSDLYALGASMPDASQPTWQPLPRA
jgi:hypothetical protein